MKYAVIQTVNGNFKIVSEHPDKDEEGNPIPHNIKGALVKYHQTCAALWNDIDNVNSAKVEMVDENWAVIMGESESISNNFGE